jgi:hypothetical protein
MQLNTRVDHCRCGATTGIKALAAAAAAIAGIRFLTGGGIPGMVEKVVAAVALSVLQISLPVAERLGPWFRSM